MLTDIFAEVVRLPKKTQRSNALTKNAPSKFHFTYCLRKIKNLILKISSFVINVIRVKRSYTNTKICLMKKPTSQVKRRPKK
jgi:hypothetical protein